MDYFERIMSKSKVFLKERTTPISKSHLYTLLQPNPLFNKNQNIAYSHLCHFIEGATHPDIINEQINDIFYKDVASIITSYINPSFITNKHKVMLLHGSAGTGKTFLVSNIISRLMTTISDEIIYVIAPTHKAKKIIYQQVNSVLKMNSVQKKNLHFSTISKFLEQEPKYDKEGNTKFITKLKIENIINLRYLFIDEASMISLNDWNDLKEFVINKLPNISVIVMGDDHQLPPVNENRSYVIEDIKYRVDVTEIVRAKSVEMKRVYETFRGFVKTKRVIIPEDLESKNFKRTHSFKKHLDNFDPKKDKIITYSNKSVDTYNNIIRDTLFGKNAPTYIEGDILVFNNIYKNYHSYFYTNDEIEVFNVNVVEKEIADYFKAFTKKEISKLKTIFTSNTFKSYSIDSVYQQINCNFNIIHEDELHRFNSYISQSKLKLKNILKKSLDFSSSELWNIFFTFQNYLNCPLKYSYAQTVYKSQGSTYRNTLIDAKNIATCTKNTYTKTLYTAVTRASNKIYYLDLLPIDDTADDVRMKDYKLWPYLEQYQFANEYKKGDIVKITQPSNTEKERKIQMVQIVEFKKGMLTVTDNVRTFSVMISDMMGVYKK